MIRFSLIFITALSLQAQFYQFSGAGTPYFDLNYTLEFEDSLQNPMLNIVTDIKYDNLSFTKEEQRNYHAKYLLKVFIKNTKTEEIYDRMNKQIEINVDEFNKTNSRKLSSVVDHNIELLEGNYIIQASLYDYNTDKVFFTKKKVNIKSSNLKKIMVNNFKVLDNKKDGDPFEISYKRNFPKLEGNIRFEFLVNKIQPDMVGEQVTIGFHIRNESREVVFTKDSMITINNRDKLNYDFTFPKSDLSGIEFEYLAQIMYKKEVLDEEKGTFSYSWNLHPNNKEQMRIALDQMRYVMDADTVEKYSNVPLDVSINKFKFFWTQLSNSKSELEAANLTREYFKRVLKASRLFKQFSFPGWKTDRGRIYVKFGEPDEVYEFRRTESNYAPPRTYRVWKYYNERKSFTFYDFDGFEDFRLTDESRMQEYQ